MRHEVSKVLDHPWLDPVCVEHGCQSIFLEERAERFEAALVKMRQWGEAYPLDIFPEPDMAKAAELLKAGGMTLDSISASNIRFAIERVVKIANDALTPH